MNGKNSSDILKIDDAARYLGVTRRWIYRRIWNGELPASKVGGLYFIRREELEVLLKEGESSGAVKVGAKAEVSLLKCGYCFRLLESDKEVGDVCAAEECETILCNQCVADGIRYCANHVPDRRQLWEAALEEHRQGKLPLLIKASQARLREVSILQRVGARLGTINTLRHPLSDEILTVENWEALRTEGDGRSELMKLMNKTVLEAEWLSQFPLNGFVRYRIPATKKPKNPALEIMVQVYSHSREMIQKGFDTDPLNAEDLPAYLLLHGEQAQKNQTVTLTMLAATTGWGEDARQLIVGSAPGTAFAHQWMLVYLNDLEKREMVYNRLDSRTRGYAELFSALLPEEEADEAAAAIEKEMRFYDSFTLPQALQVLSYPQKSIEKAFANLAASGGYALTELPGVGPAIIRT